MNFWDLVSNLFSFFLCSGLNHFPCLFCLGLALEAIPPKFMRPRQYARRINVSSRSVYLWIANKLLPSYKFRGCLLVDIAEADAVIMGMRRNEIKAPGTKRARDAKVTEVDAK
jgi:hypothetical protein